jgi:importin subunit alpha-1
VLGMGSLEPLLAIFEVEEPRITLLRNATWTLSNYCRGKPSPDFKVVGKALPTLAKLIATSTDTEVLTDAAWALSFLTEGPNERIQAAIEVGVCSTLIKLLNHTSFEVLTPALRAVGNIATGDDLQNQTLLNFNAIPELKKLTHHERINIRKEAFWTISNIAAGNHVQIEALLESGTLQRCVESMSDPMADVRKEAVWAVSNALSGGTAKQIATIASYECIPQYCNLLKNGGRDEKMTLLLLEGLENLFLVKYKDHLYDYIAQTVMKETQDLDLIASFNSSDVSSPIKERAEKFLSHVTLETIMEND